jgi:hypothetical protein
VSSTWLTLKVEGNEGLTSMMTTLVLICSLAKTPFAMDCGTDNAVDVLRVPGEYYSLVVKAQEVIRGQAETTDGWFFGEASMRPMPVVAMEPRG